MPWAPPVTMQTLFFRRLDGIGCSQQNGRAELTMTAAPDLLPFVKGLAFPESPRWHDGALWFSDFYTRRVSRVSPDGRMEAVVEVPGPVSYTHLTLPTNRE